MTSILEAVRWDMVAAGFQLALCAAVVLGWIRRRRAVKGAAAAIPEAPPGTFAQEVLLQTIRQQTEHSLQCILAAVENERGRLRQALAGAGALPVEAGADAVLPAVASDGFRWGAAELDGRGVRRYAAASGLAAQGLNPRQIADRLNLPAGEIELALKLHGALGEDAPAGEGRQ
jgi:hypothetical protein